MDTNLSERLQQIFGAYVRQETLEAAAAEMADLGRAYPDLDNDFRMTLAEGIEAARTGDTAARAVVEKSGYRAPSPADAELTMTELLRLYEAEFDTP